MRYQARRRFWKVLGLLLAGAALLPGCGGYGEIGPHAYDYASALYSICNQRDESRLEEFSAKLSAARRTRQITDQEADWLADIASQAGDGEWTDASSEARRMLVDQIEGGP